MHMYENYTFLCYLSLVSLVLIEGLQDCTLSVRRSINDCIEVFVCGHLSMYFVLNLCIMKC